MTKTPINIYRGLKEKFDPTVHVGLYIASDTGELLVGEQSLGLTITGYTISDGKLTLQLNTGENVDVTLEEATATTKGLLSASDKQQLTNLQTNLNSKVDKVSGKSLVLDTEISKLSGLPNSTELTNSIGTAKAAGDNAQTDLNAHKLNTSNPHSVTKSQVGLGNVTNDAQVKRSEMGTASGVATLDADGKVPSSQLPSYVDDVLEYNDKSAFPTTGETGKIYVDTTTNLTYRWSGSAYIEISQSLALGETSSTAYAGDKGKANAENIDKIKNTQLSHINDSTPFSTSTTDVKLNYTCYEGSQYGSTGTSHTASIPAATTSTAGVMSSSDKTKLDGIATGAEVNQNAFSKVIVGSTTVAADAKEDTLTLTAGDHITLTPDATNDSVTIASTYNAATTSVDGLMSFSDKLKLDGIAASANNYTHPTYTAITGVPTADQTPTFGGTFQVTQPVSNGTGHITAMNTRTITIPSSTATTLSAGLMSATDKTKLDNITWTTLN